MRYIDPFIQLLKLAYRPGRVTREIITADQRDEVEIPAVLDTEDKTYSFTLFRTRGPKLCMP
jgi:hypothetical protein